MKITLTQSGIVSNVSCVFLNAKATNDSTNTTNVCFYGNVSAEGIHSIIEIPSNLIVDIQTLGGLDTNNGLYVDIGNCSSVEVEII